MEQASINFATLMEQVIIAGSSFALIAAAVAAGMELAQALRRSNN